MTKKSIKKREAEVVAEKVEGKIEAYFNQKLTKDGTPLVNKKEQIDSLNKVEKHLGKSIHKSTPNELWNIVENREIAESTKRKIQFRIKGYLEYYKLPCELFKKYLTRDKNGHFPNISTKATKSEPEPEIEEKKLPLSETLRQKLDDVKNKEYKLLLSILINNDIPRCDLALVKVRNFTKDQHHMNNKTNTIIIPSSNKKYERMEIKLTETESELYNSIEFKTDYLLNINSKTDKGRCNRYSQLIPELTLEYFGERLTQTELRKCAVTDDYKKNEHLPEKQKIEALTINASKRGHSLNTALRHYLQDSTDINVCLKFKDTLNIVDENGEIEDSFDLKETVKVMRFYKLFKKEFI